MKKIFFISALACSTIAFSQNGDPKLTEIWQPEPRIVTPGVTAAGAPSDAVVLFNGKDLSAWESMEGKDAKWTVEGDVMTVAKGAGVIKTKQSFGDCQLHIEWRSPAIIKGEGQGRGNSGIFLMGLYDWFWIAIAEL